MAGQIYNGAKLFASVDRRKLHRAKITMYTLCLFVLHFFLFWYVVRLLLVRPSNLFQWNFLTKKSVTKCSNSTTMRKRKSFYQLYLDFRLVCVPYFGLFWNHVPVISLISIFFHEFWFRSLISYFIKLIQVHVLSKIACILYQML